MSSALRSVGAWIFLSVVVGALVGSYCDLQIPFADLASLERMPESGLAMPGATPLGTQREDHRLGIDGPSPAWIQSRFGTDRSPGEVVAFHAAALAVRGWVTVPGFSYFDDSRSAAWCYAEAAYELHVSDPAKLFDHTYATRYTTRLSSADNHTWRALGRPCLAPVPPPLREAGATAVVVAAIGAFFVAAQLARQRALTLRGASEVRALGFGGLSAYFLWVPYLVVWQRFGPAVPLPEAVRWAGLALALAGVALSLWAMFTLGRHYDLELELHRGHQLVRRGPFMWVRHPVYTGLALHFVGVCLATGNWILIAGTLLVTFPAFYARARTEERLLRERFGPEYGRYVAEVPMLVPGLRRPRG